MRTPFHMQKNTNKKQGHPSTCKKKGTKRRLNNRENGEDKITGTNGGKKYGWKKYGWKKNGRQKSRRKKGEKKADKETD